MNLAGAEIELVGEEEWQCHLRRAIAPLREEFDFIFIDCPPFFGGVDRKCAGCRRQRVDPDAV